jgi:uncharacterized cupredoxin-like copper-binding protein
MLVIPSLLAALAAVPLLPHAGRGAPTVQLAAKEFLFIPKEVSATSGHVTFVVQNQGAIEHDLVVAGPGGNTIAELAIIEPGETSTLNVTLPPGTYTLYCNLPGHREAGMVAALRVDP